MGCRLDLRLQVVEWKADHPMRDATHPPGNEDLEETRFGSRIPPIDSGVPEPLHGLVHPEPSCRPRDVPPQSRHVPPIKSPQTGLPVYLSGALERIPRNPGPRFPRIAL